MLSWRAWWEVFHLADSLAYNSSYPKTQEHSNFIANMLALCIHYWNSAMAEEKNLTSFVNVHQDDTENRSKIRNLHISVRNIGAISQVKFHQDPKKIMALCHLNLALVHLHLTQRRISLRISVIMQHCASLCYNIFCILIHNYY